MGKKSRPTLPADTFGNPLAPVFLVGRDGVRRRHASRLSLARAVGERFLIEQVGLQFEWLRSESSLRWSETGRHAERRLILEKRDWIIRDALGAPLDSLDFQAERQALRDEARRGWRFFCRQSFPARLGLVQASAAAGNPFHNGGPVPGTGRWRRGRNYRHPATHAQNRDNCLIDAESGEPPARGKRRKLPNAWDDFFIHSQLDRCWKRHRSQQHKGSGSRRSKEARGADSWPFLDTELDGDND